MKKLLAIVVLGLLLMGCATTTKNKITIKNQIEDNLPSEWQRLGDERLEIFKCEKEWNYISNKKKSSIKCNDDIIIRLFTFKDQTAVTLIKNLNKNLPSINSASLALVELEDILTPHQNFGPTQRKIFTIKIDLKD